MSRSTFLKIRLTTSELDDIQNQARLSGLNLSKFVRTKLWPQSTAITTQPTAQNSIVSTDRTPQPVPTTSLCPRCTRIGRPACYDCRKNAGLC